MQDSVLLLLIIGSVIVVPFHIGKWWERRYQRKIQPIENTLKIAEVCRQQIDRLVSEKNMTLYSNLSKPVEELDSFSQLAIEVGCIRGFNIIYSIFADQDIIPTKPNEKMKLLVDAADNASKTYQESLKNSFPFEYAFTDRKELLSQSIDAIPNALVVSFKNASKVLGSWTSTHYKMIIGRISLSAIDLREIRDSQDFYSSKKVAFPQSAKCFFSESSVSVYYVDSITNSDVSFIFNCISDDSLRFILSRDANIIEVSEIMTRDNT